MARLTVVMWILAAGVFAVSHAAAEDHIASIGDSSPAPGGAGAPGASSKLVVIVRALYEMYPIRALVPADADSAATRRCLIDGVERLKETGELWRILPSNQLYSNW